MGSVALVNNVPQQLLLSAVDKSFALTCERHRVFMDLRSA